MQLVWDMDGTLLDSGVVVPAAYLATVHALGGPALAPEQVVERYRLGVPELILADALGRGVTTAEADVYYRHLAEAHSVPPTSLAYIGDAPNDLRAARAVGSLAAAAAWGHQYDPAEPANVTLAAPGDALSLLD